MRNRYILYPAILVLMISLILFSGCSSGERSIKVTPPAIKPGEAKTREYLSITNTEYVNGTDSADGMKMNVYTYDLESKALNKMTDLPYNSQYPLTVVSLAEDTTYYSGEGKNKGDELFAYDMRTQQVQQLSSNLFAINAIIPDVTENTLMMAAVQKGERPVKVMFLDKATQKISILNEQDSDTTTWDIAYDPETEKAYAIQYSEEEQYEQMEKSNQTQKPMVPPSHTVLEIDPVTNHTRAIIKLKDEQILTLSARGDQLLIATAKHVNKMPIGYSLVDLKTGQRKELHLPIKASSELFLDKNGNGFYFLGEKGNGDTGRGIYYYDMKTDEIETVFLQKEGFINNFTLVSEPGKK
ncbi:hypothetical protein M3629_11590 [Paenibacillus polysaccharolyticus]|uniref:hypothetical protein n=1 Tax=Paenibacillus polysaccharolyticus TaxID=582692 RepID=UPI00203A4182|nr:hypothetical protein [Paenibacillus polysaccharolyticus]MCM3133440.1 hypothetical protein [Paenibacillus polysaccharolyticus]